MEYRLTRQHIRLLLAALCITFLAKGQLSVNCVYNNSKIGIGGINLLISKTVNKNQFGFGLRINLYSLEHKDNQSKIYDKRFYPIDFYQNFGLAGYYEYNLLSGIKPTRFSLFTDLQITYGPTRNQAYFPYITLPDGTTLYEKSIDRYGPFLWLENTIGLSLQTRIYHGLFLNVKAGGGLMSIVGDKLYAKYNTAVLFRNDYDWVLTYTFQVGLIYSFSKA